ncbi:unnamed protein product [Parnassius apollo]|uniref:(apollo) hypothetical protein n=1 Tax=Parnassius apollo TaxID=110799 RepID=A0A8S3W540_PARAO|nr:unnamed protein product [Parnassius apollo]
MNAKNSHNHIENNSRKYLAGGDNIKIKRKAGDNKGELYKLFGTAADDRRSHQNQTTNSLKATLKYINSNYVDNHSSIVNFNGSKCSVKDTQGHLSVRRLKMTLIVIISMERKLKAIL